MDADDRADLKRLFTTVQRGGDPDYPDTDEPFFMSGGGPQALIFRGESIALLRDLQGRLAKSGFSGGPLLTAVESLVVTAARRAETEDHDEVIDWLVDELESPPKSWTFFDPVRAQMPREELELGPCTLFSSPTDELGEVLPDVADLKPFSQGFFRTTVSARDHESARNLADEAIDEAKVVLSLLGTRTWMAERTFARRGGTGSVFSLGGGEFFSIRRCDKNGHLWPGYLQLTEALGKVDRNDWERRTIAAARWWARAHETSWPSESLANAMIAFETLFVRDRTQKDKGATIAKSVTERWVLKNMKAKRQQKWLRVLYSHRTDVSHEGAYFLEDLDVVRLLDLLDLAVHWAVWHLGIWHLNDRYAACSSFDEVMAPHMRANPQ